MNPLEQRKRDIKSRIQILRQELNIERVRSLQERIAFLEDDLRTVLDEIREEEKRKKEA